MENVITLFERCVQVAPFSPSLQIKNTTITYDELNQWANRLAHLLIEKGVKNDDIVAILFDRSAEMMVAIYGILKAGGAYLPIEPGWPTDRIRELVMDSGSKLLLTKGTFTAKVTDLEIEKILFDGDKDIILKQAVTNPCVPITPQSLAYIIYTSGSTGKPKGVMIEHGALMTFLEAFQQFAPTLPGDRCLSVASYSFDVSVSEFFTALTFGACLYIINPGDAIDIVGFAEYLTKNQITIAYIPPSIVGPFSEFVEKNKVTLPFKRLLLGVEPLRQKVLQRLLGRMPGGVLLNGYGPTETTVCATALHFQAADEPEKITSIGKALPGYIVLIVDENFRKVSVGEVGQIIVGGRAVARGYLKNDKLTAEKFKTGIVPEYANERFYLTGDQALYLENGNIEFIGRIDNQIKHKGYRIELGEIEAALENHELVERAAVIATSQENSYETLTAFYTSRSRQPVDGLSDFLLLKLPAYMVPEDFIHLEKIPVTSSDKIDRIKLKSLVPKKHAAHKVAGTTVEDKLYSLYQEVLKDSPINRSKSLFELGGDSIKAMEIMLRLYQDFGLHIPVTIFYENSSVDAVLELIRSKTFERTQRLDLQLKHIPRNKKYFPVAPAQHELYILHQLDESNIAHNILCRITFDGLIDKEILKATLQTIVNRHESFRTSFVVDNGELQQQIVEYLELDIPLYDFSLEKDSESALNKLEIDLGRHIPDVGMAPLFRFTLVKLTDSRHYLYLMIHHLIFDGWSLGVLLDEIKQVYTSLLSGLPVAKDESSFQYLDYAHLQQEKLATGVWEDQFRYWQKRLADLPSYIRLSSAKHPNIDFSRANRTWWHMQPGEIGKVKLLAKSENTSVFVVLLSVYYLLLSRISGQRELILTTPYANRNEPGTDNMIGYFTNMVALRASVDPHLTVHEFIRQTDRTCREAYSNSSYPFGNIIKRLGYSMSGDNNPIFQIMFIMQNWTMPNTEFNGITISQKELGNQTAKSQLTLNVDQNTEGIECWFEYPENVFNEDEINLLVKGYNELLQEMTDEPLKKTGDLSFVKTNRSVKTTFLMGEGNMMIKCTELLLEKNWKVEGIICEDSQLIAWAKNRQINFFAPEEGLQTLRQNSQIDYLFSINNDTIIPEEVINDEQLCIINFHNSLLPAFAGLFASSWVILNNEKKHGISWHLVTQKIDAGDICIQKDFEVNKGETAGTLNLRGFETAMEAFGELLQLIDEDKLNPQKQNLDNRSYFGRFKRPNQICLVGFEQTAGEIDRLCRACNLGQQHYNDFGLPRLIIAGSLYCIPEVQIIDEDSDNLPGTVLSVGSEGILLSTKTKKIRINYFLTADGDLLEAQTIAQKHGLKAGNLLGDECHADAILSEKAFYVQIMQHENFWLHQLLSYQPMAFPLFPEISEPCLTTPVETFTINLKNSSFYKEIVDESGQNAETVLLSAVALFLAKMANTDRLILPVSFAGTHSPFVHPYIPLCFDFDKKQSFEAQTAALHQTITNQKSRIGFFHDLFIRHPELKQRNRGERFQDSRLAVVIQHDGVSGFVPFKNAATHIIIDVKACTITLKMEIENGSLPKADYTGDHLLHFLEKLTQAETPVSALNLLTRDECEEYITGFDNKPEISESKLTFPGLFDLQVKSNLGKAAIEYKAEIITYRQLDQMAGNVARALSASGFTPGSIAGIMMERSPLLIAGMLGILKAGGAYLPLDATFPQTRIEQIIADAQLKFVLVSANSLPIVSGKVDQLIEIENAVHFPISEKEVPETFIKSELPAYIIYTSGSTGKPKGVEISHRALVSFTQSAIQRYNITPADRILQFATFTFDTAVEEIFTALGSGATLVLRTNGMATSVHEFIRLAQATQLTVLDLPTAFWQQLITTMAAEGLKLPDSVRLVIIGGEAVQMQAVKTWKENFGNYPKLINTYGPTETTVVATTCYLDETVCPDSFPIGKPLGNTTVYVTDKDFNPVLPGVPGHLVIGGPQVATGYINDETLSKSRFIPDVFSQNTTGRLYLTGDLVTRNPDGSLVYLGRMDKQIKIRGFRVEPEEIDRLLSASGMVNECLTILHEQPEVKRLVSYVIPKTSLPNLQQILHEYLAKRLSDYMIPSVFVPLASFPLNRNMKIDVSALPPPDFDIIDDDPQQELSATQTQLRNIFNKVLKAGKSGLNSNFFYLGGDSLLALALLSEIKTVFRQDISIAALYENPTLAQLAAIIDKHRDVSSEQKQILPEKVGNYITCLKKGGDVPPVFTIYLDAANGWLPGLLPDEQPVYTFIPQGSDGERIKYKTVETIASFYLDSMLKLFPETPVHLIGFSFGGLVALEMALQLQRRGIGFSTLTLIDTVAPQVWREMISQTDFRQKLRYFTGNQKRKFYLLLGQKIPASLRNAYILHSWRKAAYRYSPVQSRSTNQFYLIRSKTSLSELPLLGWENWPAFKFDVTIFEGDHHSIIRQREKVGQLAEWMKTRIIV